MTDEVTSGELEKQTLQTFYVLLDWNNFMYMYNKVISLSLSPWKKNILLPCWNKYPQYESQPTVHLRQEISYVRQERLQETNPKESMTSIKTLILYYGSILVKGPPMTSSILEIFMNDFIHVCQNSSL